MEKNLISTERIPKFSVLAGIGAISVYIFSSIPFIFVVALIKVANLKSQGAGIVEQDLQTVLKDLTSDPWVLVGGLIVQCVCLFLYAYGLSLIRGTGNPFNDFGIKFTKSCLLFIPAGLGLQIFGLVIGVPLTILKKTNSEQAVVTTVRDSRGASFLVLMFLVAIIVPFAEELCFRGIFMRGLNKKVVPFTAVFITGALFAGIHLLDPGALLGTTTLLLFGFLASSLAMYRGRIDASVCLHIGFNLTTVFVLIFTR